MFSTVRAGGGTFITLFREVRVAGLAEDYQALSKESKRRPMVAESRLG